MEHWRNVGSVGAVYRKDKEAQINRAFDYIICLEANKQAPTVCPVSTSAQTQAPAK